MILFLTLWGGLTRYYLRYGDQQIVDGQKNPDLNWMGAKNVNKAILVGTPNAGSVQSFSSPYEMVSRSRFQRLTDENKESIDLFDIQNWMKYQWGLASYNDPKLLKALKLRLDNGKRFTSLMDVPADPPNGTELYLMAGDSKKTIKSAQYSPEKGFYNYQYGLGDGTVLRTSTVMDEREAGEWKPQLITPINWKEISFYYKDHLGLTQDPQFIDNLLFLLLEKPMTK